MSIKIALAGNPNSGKTTMFNNLTGSSQRVGNWPGVTVEKKEGKLKGNKNVVIQDLPGIYSLSPYTLEEVVAREYLINEKPDAIINIIDATNIERNLYLTTQLMELGIPVVIALNMFDVVQKNGDSIDVAKLTDIFGCPIVETSAVNGQGVKIAVEKAIAQVEIRKPVQSGPTFADDVEHSISGIEKLITSVVHNSTLRWHAIKLFERDEKVLAQIDLPDNVKAQIEAVIVNCEAAREDESESIITGERYNYIAKAVRSAVRKNNTSKMSLSDKVDQIVTNRVLALPVFTAIMFLVYYIAITTVGGMGTDWVNEELFGALIPETIGSLLESIGTAPWLSGLILDGIVAGVGAVLGFLPQMFVLFICLAILEDCGYMARIAFIMDRIFRNFGLSGKSFIPMLITTGCGVPGIMASRTIENDNDRRMTVMTTTFVPCGAKLPIIALIAGALFDDAAWVATSTYFVGVAAIIISGIMLKKTKMFAGDPSPFIMELPAYHLPRVSGVLLTAFNRAWAFVKKATTIIMLSTILVWFLSSFNWTLEMVEDAGESMLANIGNVFAPIFAPLGWGDWRAVVATITGLIAKENVVGTFGILYGFEEVGEDGAEYWSLLQASFTQLSAYSFLLFNLLCAPCFAAIGALRREMMSTRWTLFAVGYQCVFAYAVALIVYQFGSWLNGGEFGSGTVAAIAVLVFILYLLFRKQRYTGYHSKSSIDSGTNAVLGK